MNNWMNDAALQNMDPAKKELFQMAAKRVAGKSGNAMAQTLFSLITTANKQGIHFTSEEITLIMNLMKQDKSPQEQQQIDKMVQMVKHIISSQKKTK